MGKHKKTGYQIGTLRNRVQEIHDEAFLGGQDGRWSFETGLEVARLAALQLQVINADLRKKYGA
jgi:hypothetical protein